MTTAKSAAIFFAITLVSFGPYYRGADAAVGKESSYLGSLGPDTPLKTASKVPSSKRARKRDYASGFGSVSTLPYKLRRQVDFWVKIYSVYSTSQIVIHDKDNLGIVYEVVNLRKKFRNPRQGSSAVRRYIKQRRKRVSSILHKLYRNKGRATTTEEKIFKSKLAHIKGYRKYRDAARRVRSQLGQADRFRKGLRRSGMYIKRMREIFRSHGLPSELTALPHVESSFNYKAYSSVGAAGVWQFTRGTGRQFMRINYTVDERRDPIISTHAAAKLLKQNYEKLGSWPLAITAYNHGINGMLRAKRRYGSDIVKIIDRYRSRTFGFASRNFYAEFLAALEVSRNYRAYFGPIDFLPESKYEEIVLSNYIPARSIAKQIDIPLQKLKSYNLSLRQSVWRGHRHIPTGFRLRVPAGHGSTARAALAALSSRYKHSSQKHDGFHLVRRGDTLSTISQRYRTTVRAFKDLNGLRSSLIRSGQRLRIPESRTGRVRPAVISSGGGPVYYVVKRGDNLTAIAWRHRTTVTSLARLNRLSRNATIYPGQRLHIAGSAPSVQTAVYVKPAAPPPVQPVAVPPTSVARGAQPASGAGAVIAGGEPLIVRDGHLRIRPLNSELALLTVQQEETLGHYSEWARISLKSLRKSNHIGRNHHIKVGETIRVPLTRVSPEQFENRRLEFHMQLFEDFFEVYRVEEVKEVVVRRGQSLWDLCMNEHDAPLWLVQLFNPDKKLIQLHSGDTIIIPTVVKK